MESGRKALARLEKGLPATWYRDPSHYELELAKLWYRSWIAVCREEEIPSPGDWKTVRIGTQSIVVLRGRDGGVSAFHNTCRHRGSMLCTAEAGRFERERIVCPYHAWTYSLEGSLIATPRRMALRHFRTKDFSLFSVAAETWGGFVFVRVEGKEKFPLKDQFKNYNFRALRVGKRIVADVKANWKLIAENFSECFHCPPVHPELCRVVTAYREAGAWGLRGEEEISEYKPGTETLTMDGSARIPSFRNLDDAEKRNIYVPFMLPPNLFLNVHPDYVNAHMMFPTGPESVRIVYDWLFEPEHLPKDADLEHYIALWEVTNKQDARNCEWQQQGMQSRRFKHGFYVPQEFDCHRFARWIRKGLLRRTQRNPS
jgi:glycine betaine catabolism A